MSDHRRQRRTFMKAGSGMVALAGIGGLRLPALAATRPDRGPAAAAEIDDQLREMEAQRGRYHSVARQDGELLSFLVKASRADRVLEVGTSQGYSALWMGLALQETGGQMATIDIEADRVALAKENLSRAKLDHRVRFLQGDGHQVVPELDGPFDLVFLDADKGRERHYFESVYPDNLTDGAILVVHNAIMFEDQMEPYMTAMEQHEGFDHMVVSLTMEDGMSVSYRRRL